MLDLGAFDHDQEISQQVAVALQDSKFARILKKSNEPVYEKFASSIEFAFSLCSPSSIGIIENQEQLSAIIAEMNQDGTL
ncbi:MAG: hypothetical protein M1162_01790, partial [Candidatus Thermoplasmatota archaeon]|nr:hypothetical protein [Candidatus Thermoplasmatota archaeon]